MVDTFQTDLGILYNEDCFIIMKQLIESGIKVDMILADIPYGTTRNRWDTPFDLEDMWKHFHALIKERGAMVLTAQTPFDKVLGVSNLKNLKYEWIWEKSKPTGHLNSKKMPLKNHENVLVFYKKPPTYNPQFTEGKPYVAKAKGALRSSNYGHQVDIISVNDGFRYPKSIQKFPYDKNKLHPTQKPLNLFKYMIKTYTNRDDIVLDIVMGSATTAMACEATGRRWIGMENNKEYYNIGVERIRRDDG